MLPLGPDFLAQWGGAVPLASEPPDRCAPNDRHSHSISDTQHAMDGSTCVCCGGPGCERAVIYGVIVRVKMRRRRVTHRSNLWLLQSMPLCVPAVPR